MTNYQSNTNNSESATPLTLDDMLEAVRLLKRPLLWRIEIGEDMFGFVSDMICRASPKPLLDDTVFGAVPIVGSEWLPAGWARGVDQEGDTLFLLTREHFYDFSKVPKRHYLNGMLLPVVEPPTDQLVFWNNWWSPPFGEFK